MADSTATPTRASNLQLLSPHSPTSVQTRPLAFRARSESDTPSLSPTNPDDDNHLRRKSTYATSKTLRIRPATAQTRPSENLNPVFGRSVVEQDSTASTVQSRGLSTPPMTPVKPSKAGSYTTMEDQQQKQQQPEIMTYDFSKIDYELDRAKILGTGLWSTVYLAEPIAKSPVQPVQISNSTLTPPSTPETKGRQQGPHYTVFAIKVPARPDSKPVFALEARVLTHLQRHSGNSSQYIIPFHGQDPRNSSLIFTAVIGGSLENLQNRLKQMTEVSRHLELISIFPGLARDLIAGLAFIHDGGVVHADIKPGNILLDIVEPYDLPNPVIRARYIDFSASSFVPTPDNTDESTSAGMGGGTWDYMAPEQMRIQKHLNTPTSASDVWSLGITLLSIIVGGSPWRAACGENLFLLREAIKGGDPFGYARGADRVVAKRLAAAQGFVDGLKLGLQKEREKRATAAVWGEWLERLELEG